MPLFGHDTRIRSSLTTVEYQTDLFRVSLPFNWPVYDLEGVLNANAPDTGIFTARALICQGARMDEIQSVALAPKVRESQIAASALLQRVSSDNWEGWRQEGVKRRLWGLFRDWWLFAAAYRDPVLVTIVAAG